MVPERPVRMLVVGDSTAIALAKGIDLWAGAHPNMLQVESVAAPGCGLMRGSRTVGDTKNEFRNRCDKALDRELNAVLSKVVPDLVVILVTVSDASTRRYDDGTVLQPDTAEYEARRMTAYRDFVERLRAAGVQHIAWLLAAKPAPWTLNAHPEDPKSVADSNRINATVTALNDPIVCPINLRDRILSVEVNDDHSLRPDGLHLAPESAALVMDDYLAQRLLQAALTTCPTT